MLDVIAVRLHLLMLDRRGVTSIEYGMIAIFIAVVIVTAVKTLGTNVGHMYTNVASAV